MVIKFDTSLRKQNMKNILISAFKSHIILILIPNKQKKNYRKCSHLSLNVKSK